MANPSFDSSNPHFRNKFASLAAVRNAVVPVLAKHGISVNQDLASVEGGVACTTILSHGSGQQMRFGPLILPVSKNDAQGFGSAATYARRYSLMAVACVVGDDDDDANAAMGKANGQAYAEPHRPQGDIAKSVPADVAEATANSMHEVLHNGDYEEDIRALRVLDMHDKLNKTQDIYIAASDRLASGDRSAWKKYIAMAKTREAADKAISNAGKRF
jgi:hypothetical protein